MTELTLLLILGLIGYYWHNQTSALDLCRLTGIKLTQQKGWVFLDDSLIQKAIRIKPRRGKLALHREFEFEFSDPDARRHRGTIVHHGGVVVEIKFFHFNEIQTYNFTQQ
jgi:hypothetical protein